MSLTSINLNFPLFSPFMCKIDVKILWKLWSHHGTVTFLCSNLVSSCCSYDVWEISSSCFVLITVFLFVVSVPVSVQHLVSIRNLPVAVDLNVFTYNLFSFLLLLNSPNVYFTILIFKNKNKNMLQNKLLDHAFKYFSSCSCSRSMS